MDTRSLTGLAKYLCATALAAVLTGQGVITTIAGTTFVFPDTPLPASDSPLGPLFSIAAGPDQSYFIADATNSRVRVLRQSPTLTTYEYEPGIVSNSRVLRVDRNGVLTVAAGNGIVGFSGDGGPAIRAALNYPQGVTLDLQGNLYISDTWNHRVRRVSQNGTIETVAGTGTYRYSGDGGRGTSASLAVPMGLATDGAGNLYIADMGNSRVRKLTPSGIITTIAGTGNFAFTGDGGSATSAGIGEVRSIAVDSAGNLYIADAVNHRIRRVDTSGVIRTIAGLNAAGFSGDGGPATAAALNGPRGLSVDSSGTLFIADFFNNRIRSISASGIIRTLAGSRLFSFGGDGGPATAALLAQPTATAVDTLGNLLVADTENYRVRRISRNGTIETIAGNGRFKSSGDDGPAVSASLFRPQGLTVDRSGNIFLSDYLAAKVRRIDPAGIIRAVAGTGSKGFTGDGGPARQALLFGPESTASDTAGNLYFADSVVGRVRRVTPSGTISTIAGTGALGIDGGLGGPAVDADLRAPRGLAFDASGNLLIGESLGIKRVSPTGVITRLAGLLGGGLGEGGPASRAGIDNAAALCFDMTGNLYFTDPQAHRVRRISTAGVISTIAGTGVAGFSGDGGLGTAAQVNAPEGIAADSLGNVYFADTNNHRVRAVRPNGIIQTIAGDGVNGYRGDGGIATRASLSFPSSIALDAAGNVLIGDSSNGRIRSILARAPRVSVQPPALLLVGRAGGAPVKAALTFSGDVPNLDFTASVPSSDRWLTVSPTAGNSPRQIEVTVNPLDLAAGTYRSTVALRIPNGLPSSAEVRVEFTVTAGGVPRLSVDRRHFSFNFPRSASKRSQTLTVRNEGDGRLGFEVATRTQSGGAWLSVSAESGVALPGASSAVEISCDPAQLAAGAYRGEVILSSGDTRLVVPVTMTRSEGDQAILLSKTGLSFTGISGGGLTPPQTIGVINIGAGAMNFSVETSTLSGGSWLSVEPTSGTSLAGGAAPLISVRADSANLAPDTYYGLVTVRAPGAVNTPHVATVMLEVLPRGSDLGVAADPPELLFVVTAGTSPSSQEVRLYNPTERVKTYRSARTATAPAFLPLDAVVEPNRPTTLVVQPLVAAAPPGTIRESITLQFDDGRVRVIDITIVIAPAETRPPGLSIEAAPRSASCSATRLIPIMSSLGRDFLVPAGWPVGLQVQVADDCGNTMDSGSVILEFSSGDPPLKLSPLRSGRWDGTWQTALRRGIGVTVSVLAESSVLGIRGRHEVSGALGENRAPPALSTEGIRSAADSLPFLPIAPGSFLSLSGERLSQGSDNTAAVPWPTELAGAIVTINEKRMPIRTASDGKLLAQTPFGISVNTSHQILVQRGTTYSFPIPVDVAPAQPAVLLLENGEPEIRDADDQVVGDANRVTAGTTIRIYCVGLGAVEPPVGAGAPGPSDPKSRVIEPLSLWIGGVSAEVKFAGLADDRIGQYLIEAVIPENAAAENGAAKVVIEAGGQTSKEFSVALAQ